MPATAVNDRLLTRPEAAEYLGVTIGTLENWACTRRYPLPFSRIGRSVRYRLSDLDAFIESRMVRPQNVA